MVSRRRAPSLFPIPESKTTAVETSSEDFRDFGIFNGEVENIDISKCCFRFFFDPEPCGSQSLQMACKLSDIVCGTQRMAHERKMKVTPQTAEKLGSRLPENGRKRILVFSPDRDLAESLSLLLEGNFEIVRETSIQSLQGLISSTRPALLLIDLFSFPSDILKVLDIIRSSRKTIPIIVLHVYQQRNPTVEDAIQKAADLVLFKPVCVDEIGSAITRLLKERAE